MASGAHAQDIFVKPNNATAHPADLGLGVKEAPKPAPAPPKQAPALPPPTQTAPTQPAPTQPVQRPIQQPVQQQRPAPPPVVQVGKAEIMPIEDTPIAISPGSGPNMISVAAMPGVIGQAEASEITKTLGLNSQEISANCTYENMVVLTIGDSGSAITMGQLPNAQQRFNGNISGLTLFPTIACRKIKYPVSGIIIEQGAFYKISANAASCQPPSHGGSIGLSFKYLGNGQVSCQYK